MANSVHLPVVVCLHVLPLLDHHVESCLAMWKDECQPFLVKQEACCLVLARHF